MTHKYFVRHTVGPPFHGPFTVAEITEQLRSGQLPAGSEMLLAEGQSFGSLKRSDQWVAIPRDEQQVLSVAVSLEPAASGHGRPVSSQWALNVGLGGLCLGFLVGILTRPAIPLLGQLPIETVLTRGEGLTSEYLFLKSAAEASFNHVLIFALICTIVGSVAGWYLGQKQMIAAVPLASAATVHPTHPLASSGTDAASSSTTAATYCTGCGKRLPDAAAFCPSCGTKRLSAV